MKMTPYNSLLRPELHPDQNNQHIKLDSDIAAYSISSFTLSDQK